MTLKDVLEVCATIIVSIGGGGAIVFGLSGFLAKVWAERGLEKQRQEYTRLNLEFSHQVDLVARRAQSEIDSLTHLRKMIVGSEFEKMCELWKKISVLNIAFRKLPTFKMNLSIGTDEMQAEYRTQQSQRFINCHNEAFLLWDSERLSIPKEIADAEARLLLVSYAEMEYVFEYPDPVVDIRLIPEAARNNFSERRAANVSKFGEGAEALLDMMRKYLSGENRKP